jgi:hypothetical protein
MGGFLMIPMRANIVGPPSVATRIRASIFDVGAGVLKRDAGDRAAAGSVHRNGPTRALAG